ncbi:MAG: DNA-directed DNA polymerase I [Candidatus Freyarchaeota archaeon]
MVKRLDDFFASAKVVRKEKPPEKSPSIKGRRPVPRFEAPRNLPPSFFVSITYDGQKGVARIKLYEPKSQRIYFWYDTTGHKPYCLTNLPPKELEKINRLMEHPRLDHFEVVQKYDPLSDRMVTLTRVVAKDPLAIGGRSRGCIRDIIPEEYPKVSDAQRSVKVWEAAIKYYQSYIYDRGLAPGMIYEIKNGELTPVRHGPSERTVQEILRLFEGETNDFIRHVESWARLLEYPAPTFRRVAIDIEVSSPIPTRVPDPREAAHPVIAAALLGSDGKKRILILRREGIEEGDSQLPPDVKMEYYDSEEELLLQVFDALLDYPFVITFNGDDFDLRYLFHRAQRLGMKRAQIPIEPGRNVFLLKYGVHIDLYKFFFNRSIQIYAFGQKYRDVTLREVGEALIGLPKLEPTKPVSELTYTELARYCTRDAEITLNLTTFNNELVMKLILILTRISRMPMEDMSRQGVSRWIRSFLHYEHRQRNMLIPNKEDIIAAKGATATKAIVKGKYKGAIVVKPTPGVHFNVAIMDFSSLYPSIIKVYNLGYQSIRCPHKECRDNLVPETSHWICRKQRALESLLIGALRDLRVKWYKPKAKDKALPNELRNWYNVIQSALKVILNASYGVFGAETFDLYCPPVAEATAAIGRYAITETIKKARELGIEVIYGDTDSVFLKAPSPGQIEELSRWAEEELGMELDVDKIYRYSVFSSRKKNYLGVLPDGSVDVKGLTGKKSHVPIFIRKAFHQMEEILSQVKSPEEFEKAKRDIRRIIRECYVKLTRREYPLEELAFHVVLGAAPERYIKTTPQHVKAARLLQKRGREIKAGDLISFVKVTKQPYVKPIEIATKNEIDVDKYVAYLHSTFDQILDALGLDFDEILGLTKLERFM